MNIQAWAASLEKEFYMWGSLNAAPWDMQHYKAIMQSVQGMSTPSTMHILNLAVRQMAPNECYLEVGTWRGSTLIGALSGNEARGIAIDDDSMDNHDGDERPSQDVWHENVARFGMTDRVTYCNGAVPAVWEQLHVPPIGVYLFDGDKSTEEAAYAGLVGVLPFLADEALIFVDDANEITIRMAVYHLERAYPQHAIKIVDIPTPGNCWPYFWNGLIAMAWKR